MDPFWDISLHIGTNNSNTAFGANNEGGGGSSGGTGGRGAAVAALGGMSTEAVAAAMLINPSAEHAPTVFELSTIKQELQGQWNLNN